MGLYHEGGSGLQEMRVRIAGNGILLPDSCLLRKIAVSLAFCGQAPGLWVAGPHPRGGYCSRTGPCCSPRLRLYSSTAAHVRFSYSVRLKVFVRGFQLDT